MTEVMRRPGRRKEDPSDVYQVTPAPSPSVEGDRVVWVHSSKKEHHDAEKRRRAIEKARVAIGELDQKLKGSRCRLRSEEAAGRAAIEEAGASRWITATVSEDTVISHRQQRRGRPGRNTVYVRVEEQRFSISAMIDNDAVRDDACFDGFWPMMTNDKEMTEADLLLNMKRQPGVENRHHVFKGVVDFVPVYLKSNERIDAFAFLGYVALLLHALIERDLRNAMRKQGIAELALYPEDRACTAPTAARVIEVLEPLCAHRLTAGDEVLKRYDPSLSPLHQQILDLLGVPTTAYLTSRTTGI